MKPLHKLRDTDSTRFHWIFSVLSMSLNLDYPTFLESHVETSKTKEFREPGLGIPDKVPKYH